MSLCLTCGTPWVEHTTACRPPPQPLPYVYLVTVRGTYYTYYTYNGSGIVWYSSEVKP